MHAGEHLRLDLHSDGWHRLTAPPPFNHGGAGVYGYPNFPADLPPHLQFWIDQALGSLDFILGDPDTTYWGGVRASMGRRDPFPLQWASIGNEDCVHPFDKTLWQVRRVQLVVIVVVVVGGGDRPSAPHAHSSALLGAELHHQLPAYLRRRQGALPAAAGEPCCKLHRNRLSCPIAFTFMQIVANCDMTQWALSFDAYDYHNYQGGDAVVPMLYDFDWTTRIGKPMFMSEYSNGDETVFAAAMDAALIISAERNSDLVAMTCCECTGRVRRASKRAHFALHRAVADAPQSLALRSTRSRALAPHRTSSLHPVLPTVPRHASLHTPASPGPRFALHRFTRPPVPGPAAYCIASHARQSSHRIAWPTPAHSPSHRGALHCFT